MALTPCTGGSPMQAVSPVGREERVTRNWNEFIVLLQSGCQVLKDCTVSFLELSNSCSYWNTEEVRAFMAQHAQYVCRLDRCAFCPPRTVEALHTYRIACSVPIRSRRCQCNGIHLPLNYQRLHALGVYPKGLSRYVVSEVLPFR